MVPNNRNARISRFPWFALFILPCSIFLGYAVTHCSAGLLQRAKDLQQGQLQSILLCHRCVFSCFGPVAPEESWDLCWRQMRLPLPPCVRVPEASWRSLNDLNVLGFLMFSSMFYNVWWIRGSRAVATDASQALDSAQLVVVAVVAKRWVPRSFGKSNRSNLSW